MKLQKAENPNWPSKNPGNPSGPGRGNNPPGKNKSYVNSLCVQSQSQFYY